MNHDNRQFVDQLLDASLDHYSSAEPRAGLEGRVLAGVAARHRTTQRRRWVFALAASALAVVVIAVAVRLPRHPTAPASPSLQATVAQPAGRPGKVAETPLKNPSGLSIRGGARATDDEDSRKAAKPRARFLAKFIPSGQSEIPLRQPTDRNDGRRPGMTASRDNRPEQFPSPAPLSEQEKLLLLYVQATPKSVLAAPVNTPEDLEIPDLKIAALEIKDLPRANNE